jgi:hypothetical protein
VAVKRVFQLFLLTAALILAQQATKKDETKKDPPKQETQPASGGGLFKNKLGYQSSKQAKDSTTLGFNGIDPNGRVDQETLSKSPSSTHVAAVAKMNESRPNDADLQAFIKEGGLK